MKLFVGLGNPGKQYESTRHNAGWIVIDEVCQRAGFTDFLYQKKFDGDVAQGMIGKRQVLALKPQTFMNKSGNSVQAVMQFYKIEPQDVLIFQDDIDLAFGMIKLKFNGGEGGHNGIRSIHAMTGQKGFRRLKLGVGRPDHPDHEVTDYVLGMFNPQELSYRATVSKDIDGRIDQYLKNTG